MFSWEIQKLLELRQYLLTVQEYIEISDIKKNPQIKRVHYEPFEDSFYIDTDDNYNFKFKVKKPNI